MEQEIRDVPASAVGNVVQSCVDNGNTRVFVMLQEDGNYTIRYS